TLMLLNIREILIISTPEDIPRFEKLFGNGSQFGLDISYKIQPEPKGIAQAFIIGEDFIGDQNVTLILGDNLFYGHGYLDYIKSQLTDLTGAIVFGYWVKDPERYGVVEFDSGGKVISIEEKPSDPKTNYAVPGLYIYDNQVVDISKNLKPSKRGELEITHVNQVYLQREQLHVQILGRGVAWLDTGTHKSLLEAGTFIETIETRQGLKVGCLEEIALFQKFISRDDFVSLTKEYPKNEYRTYLEDLLKRWK
ncbi:MAG: glucose-1-phosphate thymidylyltransferase RfbA, partial [Fidelibacterota bacterium]